MFWNSQDNSVNDTRTNFDWVFLGISLQNCIVEMLLTCPIDFFNFLFLHTDVRFRGWTLTHTAYKMMLITKPSVCLYLRVRMVRHTIHVSSIKRLRIRAMVSTLVLTQWNVTALYMMIVSLYQPLPHRFVASSVYSLDTSLFVQFFPWVSMEYVVLLEPCHWAEPV